MPAPSITRLRGGSHIPRHAFARYGSTTFLVMLLLLLSPSYLFVFLCVWFVRVSSTEFAVCDYSLLGHEVGKPVQSPTWILQDGSQWILNFFPHGGTFVCL